MYIPKELILILIGYFLCPITAYIYLEIKKYKESRKKDIIMVEIMIIIDKKKKNLKCV